MQWRVREPGGNWTQPRSDQLEAIKNYMTTGKNSKDIPHASGKGFFNVTFGDIITSYTKEDGVKVEVMFGNKNDFAYSSRVMDVFRAKKSKKKSKKRSNRLKSLKNIKNRSCKKKK